MIIILLAHAKSGSCMQIVQELYATVAPPEYSNPPPGRGRRGRKSLPFLEEPTRTPLLVSEDSTRKRPTRTHLTHVKGAFECFRVCSSDPLPKLVDSARKRRVYPKWFHCLPVRAYSHADGL